MVKGKLNYKEAEIKDDIETILNAEDVANTETNLTSGGTVPFAYGANESAEPKTEEKGEIQENNTETLSVSKNKIFQKFKIGDIVFLAITSAVMLVTCAVMPLVSQLTRVLFGISSLVTGFQMSFFVAVGLMKVRKPFALSMMLLFMAAIMSAMSPVMGVSNVFIALFVEILILLIFRGYRKNLACFVASAIIPPVSVIVPTIWNRVSAPDLFYLMVKNGWVVFGMMIAVVAVGLLGAFLGVKVAVELEKAGVLRKNAHLKKNKNKTSEKE